MEKWKSDPEGGSPYEIQLESLSPKRIHKVAGGQNCTSLHVDEEPRKLLLGDAELSFPWLLTCTDTQGDKKITAGGAREYHTYENPSRVLPRASGNVFSKLYTCWFTHPPRSRGSGVARLRGLIVYSSQDAALSSRMQREVARTTVHGENKG